MYIKHSSLISLDCIRIFRSQVPQCRVLPNGFTPWGTRAVASNEPITSIRSDGRGNYVTNRRGVNGETEVIPARYIETEGGVMGTSFGGKASNKFAALIEK